MAQDQIQNEWEAPIYKILANNDTGAAVGHQGGIVIPKDLRDWFPLLASAVSATNPTVDYRIDAELVVGGKLVASVTTRYQFQTWGGKRRAESRVTDNLGRLRKQARGDDLLLIQRHKSGDFRYRFILVRQTDPDYSEIRSLTEGRWGVLSGGEVPIRENEVEEALMEFERKNLEPFQPFDADVSKLQSTRVQAARSRAFRRKVLEQYGSSCAFCGLKAPSEISTSVVDAAHVIPRSLDGADDVRNGLALCKNHHWAFDRFLISINADRTLIVSSQVPHKPENKWIKNLEGQKILESRDRWKQVHEDALKWHCSRLLKEGD